MSLNITHSIQYIERHSEDPPLVVQIVKLDAEAISSITDYLIKHIKDLRVDGGTFSCRPTFLDIDGDFYLSEYEIWSLVLTGGANTKPIVLDYLQALFSEFGPDGCLSWANSDEKIGQECFRSFFDYLERNETSLPTSIWYRLCNMYVQFFLKWDINASERFENTYLPRALEGIWNEGNNSLYVDVLLYRLTSGQFAWQNFEDLNPLIRKDGVLKKIIDRVLSRDDLDWCEVDVINFLCASIYGSDKDITLDIYRYCDSKRPIDFTDDLYDKETLRNQKVCDAYYKAYGLSAGGDNDQLNTGFHIRNSYAESWQQLF